MLIGEKYTSRVVWSQLYDSSESFTQEELRKMMYQISEHITRKNLTTGSVTDFADGKLIYHRAEEITERDNKRVYCIFTSQEKIPRKVKHAIRAVANRGGVYSAERFFQEMIEILENPDKQRMYNQLSIQEALDQIDEYDTESMDVNELGYLISLVDRSTTELDHMTLEKIYYHLYQTIQTLEKSTDSDREDFGDPDEFLDASFRIASRYQETNNFHLALELFKNIIPVAKSNDRLDLASACELSIASIYKHYFPKSGDYIIETLEDIDTEDLNLKQLEIYYCLLGHAYNDKNETQKARQYFDEALVEAESEINSPLWIAEAYYEIGEIEQEQHYLKDATRHFLTAATMAFSAGDLPLADEYRNSAALSELHVANSVVHSALVHRMENDDNDAEYRAWEGLRLLLKSYYHCRSDELYKLEDLTEDIIFHSSIILSDIETKGETNKELVEKIKSTLAEFQSNLLDIEKDQDVLDNLSKEIEENIPLPPPIFMLLSADGRLMTMGKITDNDWESTEIEGTLLSGVISAIMSLITEVSEDKSSLRTVDAGNMQIMIEQTENAVAALLVDRDIQEFRRRLKRLLDEIDQSMGDQLKFWDGNNEIFDPIRSRATKLLSPSEVASNIDAYDNSRRS